MLNLDSYIILYLVIAAIVMTVLISIKISYWFLVFIPPYLCLMILIIQEIAPQVLAPIREVLR
jgi:hypothetical protein